MVTYQSKKLVSKFPVKDKIDFQHQNNVVYYGKCPNPNCKDDYIGETDRRVIERVVDHNKRDKKFMLTLTFLNNNAFFIMENVS